VVVPRIALHVVAALLTYSFVVWSAVRLPWHWVAVAVVVAAVVGRAVFLRAEAIPRRVGPALDVAVIALALVAWIVFLR
jgi:hypothetical protein